MIHRSVQLELVPYAISHPGSQATLRGLLVSYCATGTEVFDDNLCSGLMAAKTERAQQKKTEEDKIRGSAWRASVRKKNIGRAQKVQEAHVQKECLRKLILPGSTGSKTDFSSTTSGRFPPFFFWFSSGISEDIYPHGSQQGIPQLHLLKNIIVFPLLVLKGIYHYWAYFCLQGSKNQMEVKEEVDLDTRSFLYSARWTQALSDLSSACSLMVAGCRDYSKRMDCSI